MVAKSIYGNSVLTAHAAIVPLGWTVFVELPLNEALAPLYGSAVRTAALLGLALGLATMAALFLARRMVVPIRLLQAGAARIGAGELDRRIDIHTGDEFEGLAGDFNRMAADLQTSYADLERKVEVRTAELGRSVEELRMLSEIGQAVSSTLDLRAVLSTILTRSVGLTIADAGAIFSLQPGGARLSGWSRRWAGTSRSCAQCAICGSPRSGAGWAKRRRTGHRSNSPISHSGPVTRCAMSRSPPVFVLR
jgi:HAMP domain-containing protein